MIDCPCSWNSFEVIQSDLNESSDVKIDPPIHAENLRSCGAFTLIFMVEGAKALISFLRRSLSPAVSRATLEHGRAARQQNALVEVLFDLLVAVNDALVNGLVDPDGLLVHFVGLEQRLGAAEDFALQLDFSAVG